MAMTAFAGPVVAFGEIPGTSPVNSDRGPSLFDTGTGLINPRIGYFPGSAASQQILGWHDGGSFTVVDAVPSTAAAANIAAAQTPAAAGKLNLVTVTGAGVTVGCSLTSAATGGLVTGLLALDGPVSMTQVVANSRVAVYNPATMLSRCLVATTSNAADNGKTLTIAGYDLYNSPMTQILTLNSTAAPVTKKAFKYIASATISAGTTGTVSLGTTDTYGMPLLVNKFLAYVTAIWNNAMVTTNTGFTAPDTTSPATALTGDVRGTYTLQSASNGVLSLQLIINLSPSQVASTANGILGVPQA